ncbi:MAG: pentapeptide repeat-containing protein, partial [Kofleriaceae bacterium]
AAIDRVRTALGELTKFAVPGGDIQVEALQTPASHLDRAMRPERYQRAWLTGELAYWEDIARRFADDAHRILSADRTLQKLPRGAFDARTLAAHHLWRTSRGTQGARLDVVTADVAAKIVRDTDLAGARLEHVSLAAADLVGTDLATAELFDVDLQRARIETATFTGARLVRCELADAIAETTSFAEVRAEACDFARALLATSLWTRARVEGCTFYDADLADSQVNLAHFTGCDFRGARFTGAVLAGTVFERCDLRDVDLRGCDLRGTSFVACAFAAAHGEPLAVEGWMVAAADFSDRADASDLGDAEDLLAELVAG